MLKAVGRIAGRIGIGLMAGAAGTVAMTLVQKIEMMLSGREPSTMPAEWDAETLAKDFEHHFVYAATVALAWRLLTSDDPIH
jgi:hypothetical protein